MLKASARNSVFTRSVIEDSLKIAGSSRQKPGPYSAFRPIVPDRNTGFAGSNENNSWDLQGRLTETLGPQRGTAEFRAKRIQA